MRKRHEQGQHIYPQSAFMVVTCLNEVWAFFEDKDDAQTYADHANIWAENHFETTEYRRGERGFKVVFMEFTDFSDPEWVAKYDHVQPDTILYGKSYSDLAPDF